MSEETKNTLTPEQQKELYSHLKNLLKLKRFAEANQLSTYHLRDVILDVMTKCEEYNLI